MIISLTVQRSMRKMNMPIKRWRKYWMVRPGSIFIICRWENYFAVPFYYMSITTLQIYVSEINLTIPIFQHDVIVIECRQENGTLMTPHRYLWTLIVSVLAVMHLLGLLFSCGECSKYGLPITSICRIWSSLDIWWTIISRVLGTTNGRWTWSRMETLTSNGFL